MLRKHLGEKVKGVFYGSSIEVRDPLTNVLEKKPLKPFLIGQTTLLLERGQLRIPSKETSEIIHRQMTNFRVVNVSRNTNIPIYTDEDEHGLDAMVFALYAFMNEYPELVNIVEKVQVARKAYNVEAKRPDPLKNMIQDTMSNRNTPMSAAPSGTKRTSLGFAKRKRNGDTMGWGRRGTSGRGSGIKKRTF